ncbi:MAG: VWA domain-containing protein [Pseudomonadota bacterium]
MPLELEFLRPLWLLLIPFVLLAAVWFAYRQLGPGSWQRLVDPELAPHVLSGARTGRTRDFRWMVFALTGVLAALALAGPAWERIEQPVFRSDQALVVALDLSRSMDAGDLTPSRMQRARLKILDLLERRDGGQTALVVYSSNAFTVTPLTSDADTIASLVNSLSTDIMPSRGSYPVAAIEKGGQLLEQAQAPVGEVLLVTDGGTSPAAERYARALRDAGYTLSVLGVGTREGAPIPRSTGGFVTDQRGRIAVPVLEEDGLRKLARAGGGRYATLSADDRDLDYLLSGETLSRSKSDDAQATDQWREEGPWLVLLLLPLAALAFRKGWVLLLLIVLLPAAQQAEASVWDDLWMTSDQQAKRALENGEAEAASELFENAEWAAVAGYRAGAYGKSAAGFGSYDDPRNLYNLGNALARMGEIESAIDAYDEVLEIEPGNEDARYNRDLLEEFLREQQEQQQEQQNPGEESGGESQDQSQQDSEQQGMDAQSQSNDDGESGEPSDGEAGEMSDEELEALEKALQEAAEAAEQDSEGEPQQLSEEELAALRRAQAEEQAMEQWLRRIPNDPGGLLRRKFRYQYQRQGKDQDGNDLWPDDEVQPW